MTQPILAAEVAHSGTEAMLCLVGEIDYETRSIVRDGITRALHPVPGKLVVDMSGVSFCDSSGFGTLIAGVKQARAAGCTFVMVHPTRSVLRTIKLMGLQEIFNVQAPTAADVAEPRDSTG